MATRLDMTEAILELADSPHMVKYALLAALGRLDLAQLGAVFDGVADHHDLLTDPALGQQRRPRYQLQADAEGRIFPVIGLGVHDPRD